ncbi:MAG: hypothetical protein IPK35_00010 [Saprospiraceae bacterium]|nr:hypothetical protein [Saprospiraceae bacterium]
MDWMRANGHGSFDFCGVCCPIDANGRDREHKSEKGFALFISFRSVESVK